MSETERNKRIATAAIKRQARIDQDTAFISESLGDTKLLARFTILAKALLAMQIADKSSVDQLPHIDALLVVSMAKMKMDEIISSLAVRECGGDADDAAS